MNEFDIDKDELNKVLELSNKNVQSNVKVVTALDLKQDCLYHISFGRFSEFIPNISRRSGLSEDNTLPRVHVAPHLLGCIRGYASVGHLASKYIPSKDNSSKGKEAGYKGGFYIHRIPFRVALKPNKKLVYDSDYTDEHWLITYNELTKVYRANVIGKFVTESITFKPRANKTPVEVLTLVAEINHFEGIWLNSKEKLNKGYYRLNIIDNESKVEAFGITKEEFQSVKTFSSAMLEESINKEPNWLF